MFTIWGRIIYYVAVVAIVSSLIISGCVSAPPQATMPTATPVQTAPLQTPGSTAVVSVSPTVTPSVTLTVKKSAHYESNTPAHGSVLAGVPVNVVIDFNFDLGPGSSISIMTDDMEYGTGETIIDSNKLAMRRDMDPNAPDGLYTVNYNACWPDGSCHDGHFQFTIDRTESGNYTDLRNKTEVTVKLSEIAFKPQNIRISRGTKVIWINEDNVDHYVNTDAHPSHTYYPPQNSKVLKNGDMFSLAFDKTGIYPYHCSAHATIMTGSIIVE